MGSADQLELTHQPGHDHSARFVSRATSPGRRGLRVIDWRKLCPSTKDVQIDGDAVVVRLGRGRQHRVDVEYKSDVVELRRSRRTASQSSMNRTTQRSQGGTATALRLVCLHFS